MARPEHINEQIRRMRHDAIVEVAIELLAEKGYELMFLDEVAERAGISRMGLYRYFGSKEALAAATMRRLQGWTLAEIERLDDTPELRAIEKLQRLVAWALGLQFKGRMPTLPSQNSQLTAVLKADPEYMSLLDRVGAGIVAWIEAAQRDGDIDPALPVDLVLYTIFARACDPVPPMLKSDGHDEADIKAWALRLCFQGLAPRAPAPKAPRAPAPGGRARATKARR